MSRLVGRTGRSGMYFFELLNVLRNRLRRPAMNPLKFAALFLTVLPLTSVASSHIPADAEIFFKGASDESMNFIMDDYTFTLTNSRSTQGKVIEAKLLGKLVFKIEDDNQFFNYAERLFALESHGCGRTTIDLVIQMGPGKYGDVITRRYYRYVFSKNLKSLISEFHDPSVLALNAVLPIQTVENIPSPKNGRAITCKGSVPVVETVPEPR